MLRTTASILTMFLILSGGYVAVAETVFRDDFSGDLGQWTVTGTPLIAGGCLQMLPVSTSTGYNQAVSTSYFSVPGRYELQFSVFTDLRPGQGGNEAENIRATMPGGLEMRWAGWNYGANVYFRGSPVGTVRNTWYAWDTYKMTLNGRQARIYRNGAVEFSQTLGADPDFAAYPSISLYTKTAYGNRYDNVTMSFYEAWEGDSSAPFGGGETGCAALYHLDGNLNSAVGGPVLQQVGGITRYVPGPGTAFGSALEFDAASKPFLHAADGGLPATQDLEVDIWVKPYVNLWPSALAGVSEAVIVSKDGALALAVDTATKKLIARLGHGSPDNWDIQLSSASGLDTVDWYHVILRFDGSDVKLVINGIVEAAAHWPGGQVAGGADLTVGATAPASSPAFVGVIDELAVLSRTVEPWPADGAGHVVRFNPVLRWCPSPYAASYRVYFGTDAAAVQNATTGSPEYKGSVTTDNYTGLPELDSGTTYYWRIDLVVSGEAVPKGKVQSFQTVTSPLGLTVDGGVLKRTGKPFHNIGINYYDAFVDHLGDGDNTSFVAKLAALPNFNIKYIRMDASQGLGRTLLYWVDKAEFFRRLDNVVAAAEANGLGIIPSLFWRWWDLPDSLGESCTAWADNASRTRAAMRTYVREVVMRYMESPAIWGWEFGNEYNLDMPAETYRPAAIAFAAEVRKYDPYRFIVGNCSCRVDYPDALQADNPDPLNTLCVHWYQQAWGDTIANAMARSVAIGKPLFVGEFGAHPANDTTPPDQYIFEHTVIPTLVNQRVPLSALWDYEYSDPAAAWNVTATNGLAWELTDIKNANDAFDAGTLLWDDFDTDLSKWSTDWSRASDQHFSNSYSVKCGPFSNNLTPNVRMDACGYGRVTVDFWYRHNSLNSGRVVDVQLYNGTNYVTKFTISNATANNTWLHYRVTVDNAGGDAQFFTPYLAVRFAGASLGSGEYVWIDDVRVTATLPSSDGCSLRGTICLEGFRGDNTTVGVKFTLHSTARGTSLTRQSMLSADGGFVLTDIPPGTYDIVVKAYASLGTAVNNVLITGYPTVLAAPIALRGDDINGDDTVSFEDFAILQNAFGQEGAGGTTPLSAVATSGCGALGIALLAGVGSSFLPLGGRKRTLEHTSDPGHFRSPGKTENRV